jgi:hypothetical protein
LQSIFVQDGLSSFSIIPVNRFPVCIASFQVADDQYQESFLPTLTVQLKNVVDYNENVLSRAYCSACQHLITHPVKLRSPES